MTDWDAIGSDDDNKCLDKEGNVSFFLDCNPFPRSFSYSVVATSLDTHKLIDRYYLIFEIGC